MGKIKVQVAAMAFTECVLKQIENLDVTKDDALWIHYAGFRGLNALRARIAIRRLSRAARRAAKALIKLRNSVEVEYENQ